MTTLRTAAQQALKELDALKQRGVFGDFDGVADTLRAALEPDLWGAGYEAGYAAGVAEHRAEPVEPVASVYITPNGAREFDDWRHDLPVGRNLLYTAPPQRKPLTEEEIVRIFEAPELAGARFQTSTLKAIAVARAVEAAHGIKEGA